MLKCNLQISDSILSKSDDTFADDMNLICPATNDTLRHLLGILEDFKQLSGLEINRSKTNVMILGCEPTETLIDIINTNGLNYSEKIRHLGLDIDRKLECLQNNWTKKIQKVEV